VVSERQAATMAAAVAIEARGTKVARLIRGPTYGAEISG
jgi:hypothetical protein